MGSARGRRVAAFPDASEACRRRGRALSVPSLPRRSGMPSTPALPLPSRAGGLPAGGYRASARTTRVAGARGEAGVLRARMWKKPGRGKRLFLSDSVLFACCNKAQVQGNSSGLQYLKFCGLCQDRCRQFQEMIPRLLPGEQNVLLGDFTVIKLVPVANFKKHYHLNA